MRREGLVWLLAVALMLPATAWAQRGFLEQAEEKIASSAFGDARLLLQRWQRENPNAARVDQEQQARYHALRARIITNADSAEDNYLTVALNYPTSKVAPEALLRLAQARALRQDTAQAIAYLERLLADYPNSEYRPLAAVWLARTKSPTGGNAEICELMRGMKPSTNPETITHVKAEQTRICAKTPVVAGKQPAKTTTSVKPPAPTKTAAVKSPAPKDTAREPDPRASAAAARRDSARVVPKAPTTTDGPSAGRIVAIQLGAFRELSGARSMRLQLERAGFDDVRLVRVPGNTLIRVRIGKYANRSAAAAMLARLAEKNFSAVLVTDAANESSLQN
ncbi:MAG TPA: SPOR domain-containing protein [Longimicrobiales bacterium]|nr:SPOR domain-containing protein [Longimicrobiales bacterium]